MRWSSRAAGTPSRPAASTLTSRGVFAPMPRPAASLAMRAQRAAPSRPSSTLPAMTLTTYTNEAHGFGFGFVYDDARFACIDDPRDPRRAAVWSSRISCAIAASVLFTPAGSTEAEIASGATYSLLVTTDNAAPRDRPLGGWDWDDVMPAAAASFLRVTSAAHVDAYQMYWRGFPILQLTARPGPEVPSPHILEEIGMLYTPQQTFTALVVWPSDDRTQLGPVARELWDGFFLVPLEREGKVRTGHKHVRRLALSLTEEGHPAVVG